MNIGLLWFDDNPHRDLTEKIARAAKRYRKKYGIAPDVCYVHHSVLSDNGKAAKVGQIQVATSPSVLLHHLWIGQEEEQPPDQIGAICQEDNHCHPPGDSKS